MIDYCLISPLLESKREANEIDGLTVVGTRLVVVVVVVVGT